MIRRLRESHRRVVSLLALILPLGYAALLSHRPAGRAGAGRLAADLGDRVPVGRVFYLLAEPPIEARLLGGRDDSTPDALQVIPWGDPAIPDLLAYWSATASDGRRLPPDAVLIGALRGSREQVFPLPDPARTRDGYLVLFSLVRGVVLATVRLAVAS